MTGPSSTTATDGSGGRSSASRHDNMASQSHEDEARNLAGLRLRWWVVDHVQPAPYRPYHERSSSVDASIQEHASRMQSYLGDFDKHFLKQESPAPWSAPVQVFPARMRLSGEQLPYRLADGASATQPRRGHRRRIQSSIVSTSVDGEEGTLDHSPPPQHSNDQSPVASESLNLFSTFDSPSKGKGKEQPWMDSSSASLKSSPWMQQQPRHDAAQGSMNSSMQATATPAYFQQFNQQWQGLPDEAWGVPHAIGLSPHAVHSPVMLPTGLVWEPNQGLFTQNQQHYQPTAINPNPIQDPHSMANSPFHGPMPYWSATSPFSLPSQAPQAVSMQSQQWLEPHNVGSPQDSNTNGDSSVPSLVLHSSSSQATSSPFDFTSIHSPPYIGVLGDEQDEGLLTPPHTEERGSDVPLAGGDGSEKVMDEDVDWSLIDFNPEQEQQ